MNQSDVNSLRQHAGRAYNPQPLDASGVLFRAKLPSEEMLPEAEVDLTNGWGELFLRGLEVIHTRGDHWSIVSKEQNIAELTSQIDAVLDRIDRDSRKLGHLESLRPKLASRGR